MRTMSYYFLVVDIETSTIKDDNGSPLATWLAYGYCNLYDRDGLRIETQYFREWKELKTFLYHIEQRFFNQKIICFAHNLAYEFDYMIKNLSRPTKILSNSTHATISSTLEDFPQIEFRCTYMISSCSLEKLGLRYNFPKLDSDYRFILPSDEITKEEKDYCIRDCDVVAVYVSDLLKTYGRMCNIPYTKTGRVRKVFNQYYSQYKEKPEWDLMPDENCYQALLDSFNGGLVFSNPFFTARLLYNVDSYDITSSYPYAMLKEKFPSKITKVDTNDINELNGYFIAKIKFYDIESKYPWQWLSNSKLNDFDVPSSRFFNGKLIYSKYAVRTITNIDYEMIKKTYNFSDLEILEFYRLENIDYLPMPYIETIKHFGKLKTELKEKLKGIKKIHGENSDEYRECEKDYMDAKSDYNSIYGMSVQKLMSPEYDIDDNFRWHERNIEYKKDPKKHMKRNFLYGIFITAYARRNLLIGILENCPYTFVYCDTDSIKFIISEFKNTNEPLQDYFMQYDYLRDLGKFDFDGHYQIFITYGAKKYCYENDGDVFITVAGLPKKQKPNSSMEIVYNGKTIDCLTEDKSLKSIKYFRCGTLFHKCKLAKKYLTSNYSIEVDEFDDVVKVDCVENITIKYLQYNKIETNGGVALFETDYLLDIINSDKKYIIELDSMFVWYMKNKCKVNNITDYCSMEVSL